MRTRRGLPLVLLLLLTSVAILTACNESRSLTASSRSQDLSPSANVTKGAWLYVEYACVQCHGIGGRGRDLISGSGPSLVSTDFKKTFPKNPRFDTALANLIKNGVIMEEDRVASMPAWNGILSEEEVNSIVAYVRAGLPNLNVPVSRAKTGEEIFKAYACVKCHGDVGVGGVRNIASSEHRVVPTIGGETFRKKFVSREEIRKIILNGRLVEEGRAGVIYMPAWGRIGTADQIEELTDYIWSVTGGGK